MVLGLGLGVWGLGSLVLGLGFGIWGLGSLVLGSGVRGLPSGRVWGLGLVSGVGSLGSKIWGLGSGVVSGFGVWGPGSFGSGVRGEVLGLGPGVLDLGSLVLGHAVICSMLATRPRLHRKQKGLSHSTVPEFWGLGSWSVESAFGLAFGLDLGLGVLGLGFGGWGLLCAVGRLGLRSGVWDPGVGVRDLGYGCVVLGVWD